MLERKLTLEGGTLYCDLGSLEPGGWQTLDCSLRLAGVDCEAVGEALGRRGIAVRAGLHCAPLAHRSAGTLETGTVRVSVSAFNTQQELRRLIRAAAELAEHRK